MRWLTLILALALTAPSPAAAQAPYNIWLVRHAEKAAAGDDPGLSEAGEERAAKLAEWLKDKHIRAIWSSDTRRTRDTAQPVADSLGAEVRIYDPGDAAAMAGRLKAEAANALVVGHSNSIPELVAKLCKCEVEPIPDDEYERLYIVIVMAGLPSLIMSNQAKVFSASQK